MGEFRDGTRGTAGGRVARETHHAASESMFPLGTRARVPAGGMPPRGLGDRRDGALLARTEERARAGLVPPPRKKE